MIHNRQFYNEGVMISSRLLSQFDKENIREELLNVYQSLLNGKK
jgi:hypothetical protein